MSRKKAEKRPRDQSSLTNWLITKSKRKSNNVARDDEDEDEEMKEENQEANGKDEKHESKVASTAAVDAEAVGDSDSESDHEEDKETKPPPKKRARKGKTNESKFKTKKSGWGVFRKKCIHDSLFSVSYDDLEERLPRLVPRPLGYDPDWRDHYEGVYLSRRVLAECVLKRRWPVVEWLLKHKFVFSLHHFYDLHGTKLNKRRALAELASHSSFSPFASSVLSVLSRVRSDETVVRDNDFMLTPNVMHLCSPRELLHTLDDCHRPELGVRERAANGEQPVVMEQMAINWLDVAIRFGRRADMIRALQAGYKPSASTLAMTFFRMVEMGPVICDVARALPTEAISTVFLNMGDFIYGAWKRCDTRYTLPLLQFSQWLSTLASSISSSSSEGYSMDLESAFWMEAIQPVFAPDWEQFEQDIPEHFARVFWHVHFDHFLAADLPDIETQLVFLRNAPTLHITFDTARRKGKLWMEQFLRRQTRLSVLSVPQKHRSFDSVLSLIVGYCMDMNVP